jgi:hypothetical protein
MNMKFISTDYYTSGFSPKIPRKRFVNIASNEEKNQFKKRLSKESRVYLKNSHLQ